MSFLAGTGPVVLGVAAAGLLTFVLAAATPADTLLTGAEGRTFKVEDVEEFFARPFGRGFCDFDFD